EKALDKALKTEFNTTDPLSQQIVKHRISHSKIYIEIANSSNIVYTIRRIINSGNITPTGNDEMTKKVIVFKSHLDEITPEIEQLPLFIRSTNNNANDFGFYHWLAEFIGIKLPEVNNIGKSNEKSPLYLQTIFPALFIEQTKGWSEFLATCPYFGIPRNKEKSIEFLLALNELSISTEKDRISKEEKDLKGNWSQVLSRLEILASEYHAEIKAVPLEIQPDKDLLITSSIVIPDEEDKSRYQSAIVLKKTLEEQINELKKLPIKKVGDNKEFIRIKLEKLQSDQNQFMLKLDNFDLNFNLQKQQEQTLEKQLKSIIKELSSLKGIKNVFDDVLIKENIYRTCPTCTQKVSTDLMASEGVSIEKLTLDENISYLDGQRKIIESAIKSLSIIIAEKLIIRKYYQRTQREFEEEIKLTLHELISDDRDYSETDTLQRVRLEKKISDLDFIQNRFNENIEQLSLLADKFKILLSEKNALEGNSEADKNKLDEFETMFKDDYLYKFGYDSNPKWNIFIQQKDPFKYFPVFKFQEDDPIPKSIRTNSSASDFVRTLWAYTLTLLLKGENHPGIVMFDEPGQHSVKSSSLKALFKASSEIKDKQIIIFTSVQKDLSTIDDTTDKLDINKILEGLTIDVDYSMYKIGEGEKCIDILK
ncbi:MAG: hypothetical protein CVU12_00005, partial [Bacteroidetes bacterium HGW-Bacteroidetes-7]